MESQGIEEYSIAVKPLNLLLRACAILALAAFVLGMVWLDFLKHQNNDFTEYYCAGQSVRAGLGSKLYDLATQFQCESKLGPVHVFYYHPPWETVLFLPLSYLRYRTAYIVWTLLSVVLLLAVVWIIESRLHASSAIAEYTRVPSDFGLLFAIFLTFSPVMTCLLLGQDSVLMLFIYTVVFLLLDENRHFLAGCALAGGLYKFQAVIPFIFILILRRKWKIVGGFSAVALFLLLASLAISGEQSVIRYPGFVLSGFSKNIGGFNPRAAPNLRGLLTVLNHGRLQNVPLTILIAVASFFIVWWTARSWRDDRFRWSFAAGVLATILASFHIYNYELSLVLLPIAIACSELTRDRTLRKQRILTAALILLFVSPLHRFLSLQDAYGLMCIPILGIFFVTLKRVRASPLTCPSLGLNVTLSKANRRA